MLALACIFVRENGSFSLLFVLTKFGQKVPLGSAFERSESCSPSGQGGHCPLRLMSDSEFAVRTLSDKGYRGAKRPCQAAGPAWAGLSSVGGQKQCLPYGTALLSFWDLWREKIGSEGDLFFRGICPSCVQNCSVIFSTRPCVGQEKILAKSLKTAKFQSVR